VGAAPCHRAVVCRLPGDNADALVARLCARFADSRAFRDPPSVSALHAAVELFAAAPTVPTRAHFAELLGHMCACQDDVDLSTFRKALDALARTEHARAHGRAVCALLAGYHRAHHAHEYEEDDDVPVTEDNGALLIAALADVGVYLPSPGATAARDPVLVSHVKVPPEGPETKAARAFVRRLAHWAARRAQSTGPSELLAAAVAVEQVLGYKHVAIIEVHFCVLCLCWH
jgi:hypothetical protein